LDINYIRYNAVHRRALEDFFPNVPPNHPGLIYSFKSTFPAALTDRFREAGTSSPAWLPKITDYYRFVLTHRHLDGVLCRLAGPREVEELVAMLGEKPLTAEEMAYMVGLLAGPEPTKIGK